MEKIIDVVNKTIIPLALAGFKVITRLAGYLSSHIQRTLVVGKDAHEPRRPTLPELIPVSVG